MKFTKKVLHNAVAIWLSLVMVFGSISPIGAAMNGYVDAVEDGYVYDLYVNTDETKPDEENDAFEDEYDCLYVYVCDYENGYENDYLYEYEYIYTITYK